MQHEVVYKPSYAMLAINLSPGESILAEAEAMVSMSPGMQVKTLLNPRQKAEGGVLAKLWAALVGLFIALTRKVLGGESFFVNRFDASDSNQEILLAPSLPGDIIHHRLTGQNIFVQAGSFLASTPGITVKLRFTGLKGFFSGESIFLLDIGGSGDLWLNAYGGIEEIEVHGGMTVDTGHLVAFEPTLSWSVTTIGGIKTSLLSGEGLVMTFRGSGKLWIQTRNLSALSSWLRPMLPG